MYNPTCSPFVRFKSAAFLGQFNRVNWNDLIKNTILPQAGVAITPAPENWNAATPGYDEVESKWRAANFNPAAIKWINYYPGKHFDQAVVDDLARYVRVSVHRAWISRVDPGFFAALHWDVDDNEIEYLKKGPIHRYSCFIGESDPGHVFILGEDHLYNQKQGTLVKWNNHREWHTGINGGMIPKFMIHIVGYRS